MMTFAERNGTPLVPGEPIVYWRVGETVETRFDVADQPMSGEMDPFFFVTDQKNFIPHEYPCRTAFAQAHSGQRPVTLGAMLTARSWLPFGAERLDLSGFWFRPTHLATFATTKLASAGGEARFRLTTPGGAILFVNGVEAGWLAPYRRNLEDHAEFTVHLASGENTVEVFFDDLAERDTRYFIRLDYVWGAAVVPLLPFDAPAASVEMVEQALTQMHFDQPSYGGGPVRLVLPTPLEAPAAATIKVVGDFMSHEARTISRDLQAGAATISLGDAADLPADFRHFQVSLAADGFEAKRTFGIEVAATSALGGAPTALSGRITEALDWVATAAEPDTVAVLARLATGRAGADTDTMIERALAPIIECWDCADFALVPLLWSRIAHESAIAEPTLRGIDRTILHYRYWMDEPGNDVQWYFSENHALLFHTAAYLAGTLLPDEIFVRSGRKGSEQAAIGAERVRQWFDHFEKWEMAEFNSAPYFPIDLKGLTILFALAPDHDIRLRAEAAIRRLMEIVANSAHQGVLTGAQGRSYEHTLRAGRTLELSAIARLLWGVGTFGRRFHALPQLALCLRDHGLTLPDLKDRALWQEDGEQDWFFTQGEAGFASLSHTKTKDWALGTAARYRWFEWGYQETLIQARIGANPDATVFINHPGEAIHSGYGRPSFWGGSASIPRVQQYRGLAVVVFQGAEGQPDFTHAYFPRDAFSDAILGERNAVAAEGDGRLYLAASGPLSMVSEGPSAGCELQLAGRDGTWLLRLGSGGGVEAFGERFSALAVSGAPDGVLTVTDPEYGLVMFHADGVVEAEGRKIDPKTWTTEGKRTVRDVVPKRIVRDAAPMR
ncbi:MAG: hypothetical protein AAF615_00660 [Pseudomonadota bacterium]